MVNLRWSIIVLTGLFACYTEAQTAANVQDDWLDPAPPDGGTNLQVGEQYTLRWTNDLWAWFGEYAPDAIVTHVDLWFTPTVGAAGSMLIASSVNVNTTYSYPYTISLTTDQLTNATSWTFRFLPAGQTYTDATVEQISSPHVYVQNAPSSPTAVSTTSSAASSSSASSASVSSSASAASTSSAAATSSSTSTPAVSAQSSSSSISGGAIAGIAIGAAAILLALVLLFFWRRRSQRKRKNGDTSRPVVASGPPITHDNKYHHPQEFPDNSTVPSSHNFHAPSPQNRYVPPQNQYAPPYSAPSELDGRNHYR